MALVALPLPFWPPSALPLLESGRSFRSLPGPAQIAFEPEDRVITENGVAVQSENPPRTSYVYSISYMLSGQDQGQLRVAQYLYNQSSAVDEVANPCFNPGYKESMQVCEGIALGSSSTCSGPKRDVMFVGTGDYEECRGVIEAAIMHKNYQCLQEPCAVAGRYQPKVGNKKFFAGSAFFYRPRRSANAVPSLAPPGARPAPSRLPTHAPVDRDSACIRAREHTRRHIRSSRPGATSAARSGPQSASPSIATTRKSTPRTTASHPHVRRSFPVANPVSLRRPHTAPADTRRPPADIPAMLDAYGIDPDKDTVTYASSVGNEALEWPLGCQLYNNLMGMANVGKPPRVVNDHTKAEL